MDSTNLEQKEMQCLPRHYDFSAVPPQAEEEV